MVPAIVAGGTTARRRTPVPLPIGVGSAGVTTGVTSFPGRHWQATTYAGILAAWFGRELLVSTGTGKLFAIDPTPPIQQRPFSSFTPASARDTGVATCNGMVVWAGLFQGITVLSGTGSPLATVLTAAGPQFSQEQLGPLSFLGNELVIADTTGLHFYALEALQ